MPSGRPKYDEQRSWAILWLSQKTWLALTFVGAAMIFVACVAAVASGLLFEHIIDFRSETTQLIVVSVCGGAIYSLFIILLHRYSTRDREDFISEAKELFLTGFREEMLLGIWLVVVFLLYQLAAMLCSSLFQIETNLAYVGFFIFLLMPGVRPSLLAFLERQSLIQ